MLCCVIAAADPVTLRRRQISLISRACGVWLRELLFEQSPSDECSSPVLEAQGI